MNSANRFAMTASSILAFGAAGLLLPVAAFFLGAGAAGATLGGFVWFREDRRGEGGSSSSAEVDAFLLVRRRLAGGGLVGGDWAGLSLRAADFELRGRGLGLDAGAGEFASVQIGYFSRLKSTEELD